LLAAVHLAQQVAPTDIPVLIVGETGTGKELLAQLIHRASGRHGDLVSIDCGALPDELAESLLFGHRRGAFTGAIEDVRGLIAEARSGTLFLDELGSLSLRGQAKLLRVLETGTVRRVGEASTRAVGFRLVATARHDLAELIHSGRFRDDLMQRVAGIVIQVPALRDRADDVNVLAAYFAQAEGLTLDDSAAARRAGREWPGNVRELKWTLARCALFATGDVIDQQVVDLASVAGPGGLGYQPIHTDEGSGLVELRAVCQRFSGDPDRVAEALGITRSSMYRRLKRAGLRLGSFRRRANAAQPV
jgi:DNA-binding NtrC family response regulator